MIKKTLTLLFDIKIILFLALLIRLAYFFNSPLSLEQAGLLKVNSDENTYYSIAKVYSEEGLMRGLKDPKTMWTAPATPLYFYFVGLFFEKDILAIRLGNIFFSLLTIFFIYKIGKDNFGKITGLFSALILSLLGLFIEFSAMLMTEPIFIFFSVLSVYVFLRGSQRSNVRLIAIAGFVMGLACLARSHLLLFPFFFLAYGLLVYMKTKDWTILKSGLVFLISFFLIISPIMLKNYVYFSKLAISTGSGAVLYLGSREDTEGDEPPYRGQNYDTSLITGGRSHLSIEGDKLLFSKGVLNIKSHPKQYLFWNVKKIGRLLIGSNFYWFFPYGDIYNYIKNNGDLKGLTRIIDLSFTVFIVIFGLFYLIRKLLFKSIVFVNLYIIYSILIYIPFLVNHRYGMSIMVFLVVYAVKVLLEKKEKIRSG
ncbi:ArnT family glycosyltransferase [Paenibacillus polymyxa]|uniref:ArnT family glycosyltransferase n=1 Tax=Paenibacillus polymyxa TaxID=1406 RepID=UPI0020251AFA|nr:glycosyltransferase family 39 protein [Paenibacillus polymyxa]URJ59864.3 glycosyltransferase family 39 protein [Paenibacillus polymyxa]